MYGSTHRFCERTFSISTDQHRKHHHRHWPVTHSRHVILHPIWQRHHTNDNPPRLQLANLQQRPSRSPQTSLAPSSLRPNSNLPRPGNTWNQKQQDPHYLYHTALQYSPHLGTLGTRHCNGALGLNMVGVIALKTDNLRFNLRLTSKRLLVYILLGLTLIDNNSLTGNSLGIF